MQLLEYVYFQGKKKKEKKMKETRLTWRKTFKILEQKINKIKKGK